jgi:hypothetical protein
MGRIVLLQNMHAFEGILSPSRLYKYRKYSGLTDMPESGSALSIRRALRLGDG